jgi:hypothetical protein
MRNEQSLRNAGMGTALRERFQHADYCGSSLEGLEFYASNETLCLLRRIQDVS